MKKIFIALAAVAALAACTKSEVQYDAPAEIGFAPVAENLTKSVAGVGNDGTYDATFPTDLNLYVFANAQADDLSAAWPDVYFENAQFIYGRIDNGVYEGTPARYWPNVKSLIFAGYSDACNIADIAENSTVTFNADKTSTIEITGYVQNNTTDKVGANDLMWFPWDTESYTKRTTAIAAQMKHACSWITVKVLRDSQTTDETWKLDGLKINGLFHKGDATCGMTAATWEVSGEQTAETLFSTSGTNLTTSAVAYEDKANNMVVIPQVPTSIDVTYSYVPQEGVDAIQETVKNLPLSYNGDAKWESGKHYIYTITITATEILIDPEVVTWDPSVVAPGVSI